MKQATNTMQTKEGLHTQENDFEKWYVDAGDYQRNKDADEIFIRVAKKPDYTEGFDVCRLGADETGEPLERAHQIVKAVNERQALLDRVNDLEHYVRYVQDTVSRGAVPLDWEDWVESGKPLTK